MPNLTIDTVLKNGHSQISLVHSTTGKSWNAPVVQDIQVSVASSYNTPLADLVTGANDTYQTLKMGMGMMGDTGKTLQKLAPVPSLLTPAYSIMTWSNSERPTFNVPLTFIATSDKDDVQSQAVSLAAMALPSLDFELANALGEVGEMVSSVTKKVKSAFGISSGGKDNVKVGSVPNPLTGMLVPPAGYSPQGNTAEGTFDLHIGTYMKVTGLILQDCQIEISKERLHPSGRALWAIATVTLVPYRIPTANEFKSWFVGASSISTIEDATGSLSNLAGRAVNTVKSFF